LKEDRKECCEQDQQVLAQAEVFGRDQSYRSISLHQFQESDHNSEGGEKATCGDENDVEKQWKEDDLGDQRTNGAYDNNGKKEMIANEDKQ